MSTMLFLNREESTPAQEGYAAWSKDELVAELERRGLPKTGNKPELVERLEADDA